MKKMAAAIDKIYDAVGEFNHFLLATVVMQRSLTIKINPLQPYECDLSTHVVAAVTIYVNQDSVNNTKDCQTPNIQEAQLLKAVSQQYRIGPSRTILDGEFNTRLLTITENVKFDFAIEDTAIPI